MAPMTGRSLRMAYSSHRIGISRELQDVLNANGMQARIYQQDNGKLYLETVAHNTPGYPRSYPISYEQALLLSASGSEFSTKQAYNSFVDLVRNDYDVPRSFNAASNALNPVYTGMFGKRVNIGEYGYLGTPPFRPFRGPRFGVFDRVIDGLAGFSMMRAYPPRPYYSWNHPYAYEHEDGRVRLGEMATGGYGFADKGTSRVGERQSQSLDKIDIDVKPRVLTRPKGQSLPMSSFKNIKNSEAVPKFLEILKSHGLEIRDYSGDNKEMYKGNKELVVRSDGVNRNLAYVLTPEEYKKLTEPFLSQKKDKHGKVHEVKGLSVDERLAILNSVISKDFQTPITREMLNSKDYVKLELRPEVKRIYDMEDQQSAKYGSQLNSIDQKSLRTDYQRGFIDKWNSIGVVDGKSLDKDYGFYMPNAHGRRLSVGEIQAYAYSDGAKQGFKMTAVVGGQILSKDISRSDYLKFINYDDKHRLELFADTFKDSIAIKSSSHGKLEDMDLSGRIKDAEGVATLQGSYSLIGKNYQAYITDAKAWKELNTGNYVLNVRDSKDIGMFTYHLTEAQYNAFKNGNDQEKIRIISEVIPFKGKTSKANDIVNLERPQGKAIELAGKEMLVDGSTTKLSGEIKYKGKDFVDMLATHGIVLDSVSKTLTIQSQSVGKDLVYNISDKDIKRLSSDLAYKDYSDKSLQSRLDIINRYIKHDFKDKVTVQQLQGKDYINIGLKPKVEEAMRLDASAKPYYKPLRIVDNSKIDPEIAGISLANNENLTEAEAQKHLNAITTARTNNLLEVLPHSLRATGDKDMIKMAEYVEKNRKIPADLTDADAKKLGNVLNHLDRGKLYNQETADALNKGGLKPQITFRGITEDELVRLGLSKEKAHTVVSSQKLDLNALNSKASQALATQIVGKPAVTEMNGEDLQSLKSSKEWRRSGSGGRETSVGNITIDRARDNAGNVIQGKYTITAVIDGNPITHEINQKTFDKLGGVDDYHRLKLFDKIFPEIEMKTKEGHKFNLGAALLAGMGALGTTVALFSRPAPAMPVGIASHQVYFNAEKGVSYGQINSRMFEAEMRKLDPGLDPEHGRGIGI